MVSSPRNQCGDRLVTVLGIRDVHSDRDYSAKNQFQSIDNLFHTDRGPAPNYLMREEITLVLNIGRKHLLLGVVDLEGPHAARDWLKSLADDFGIESSVSLGPIPHGLIN